MILGNKLCLHASFKPSQKYLNRPTNSSIGQFFGDSFLDWIYECFQEEHFPNRKKEEIELWPHFWSDYIIMRAYLGNAKIYLLQIPSSSGSEQKASLFRWFPLPPPTPATESVRARRNLIKPSVVFYVCWWCHLYNLLPRKFPSLPVVTLQAPCFCNRPSNSIRMVLPLI